MILSRQVRDLDVKARALIADLIPMINEPEVACDPLFLAHLTTALKIAESRIEERDADRKPREAITHPGKTVES